MQVPLQWKSSISNIIKDFMHNQIFSILDNTGLNRNNLNNLMASSQGHFTPPLLFFLAVETIELLTYLFIHTLCSTND